MQTQSRPNIVVILDDQHRHDFLGCSGASFVSTPNIDALAHRGMRFTHCCTNSPLCAPARIALASGLLPTRTGTTENDTFMPLSAPSHYRHFRDNDYRVELVGRHDLAKTGAPGSIYGNRPVNYSYGFTRALEVEGGMGCAGEGKRTGRPSGPYSQYLLEKGWFRPYVDDFWDRHEKGWIIGVSHDSILPKEHHQDSFVGRAAVARIERQEDDYPFYLFVSFQAPHDPFDPPRQLGDKYRLAEMPSAIPPVMEDKPERIRQRYATLYSHATAEDILVARRQYCAKIELVDEQIGLIMQALERRGFLPNTVVVFASDHGEQVGDHGLFIKHTAYESSLRVPLVVAGPGVKTGLSDALVELFDINPTLVELAGLPSQADLDARSFAPVLRGQKVDHRDCCVTCQSTYRAIRDRQHKYIETYNDREELYDLARDPEEVHNIASEHPDLVKDLLGRMHERFVEGRWRR